MLFLVVATRVAMAEVSAEVVEVVVAGDVVVTSSNPAAGGRDTRTSRLESGLGAVTIIDSESLHTFVPNPPLVPGKTSSFQDLQSETVTSSARLIRQ